MNVSNDAAVLKKALFKDLFSSALANWCETWSSQLLAVAKQSQLIQSLIGASYVLQLTSKLHVFSYVQKRGPSSG